jgi:hypothetical protein
MSEAIEKAFLRDQTGAIRQLDAARARRLVEVFARPAVLDDGRLTWDDRDSLAAATHGWLTLDHPEAAGGSAVVGHYKTHLYLHGLVRLPLSVARELVQHRGHLYLDRLVSMTDAVAAELGRHHAGGLSLNHIRRLSPAAARSLGGHGGELSLNRITRLDADVALGLARHANELFLNGLKRLSPPAAAALAQHRGDLFLGTLERLPGRMAMHLARHRGRLHLHGLTRMSDATAEAFGTRSRNSGPTRASSCRAGYRKGSVGRGEQIRPRNEIHAARGRDRATCGMIGLAPHQRLRELVRATVAVPTSRKPTQTPTIALATVVSDMIKADGACPSRASQVVRS